MRKTSIKPPRFAKRILAKLALYRNKFTLLEDTNEDYILITNSEGKTKADLWYWKQTIIMLKYYLAFKFTWGNIMFRNYFKTSIRLIGRNKIFSFINVLSLSIGLACCILIYLSIAGEYNWDDFHVNKSSLYRVLMTKIDSDGTVKSRMPALAAPEGPALADFFDEIKYVARFEGNSAIVRYEDKLFQEFIRFSDSGFFKMFSFELEEGNPYQTLEDDFSVVLSKETAVKYFGDEKALGKIMTFTFGQVKKAFVVTGVVAPFPKNSTLKFDIIVAGDNMKLGIGERNAANWMYIGTPTYVQIDDENGIENIQSKISGFSDQYLKQRLMSYIKMDRLEEGGTIGYEFQKVTDIHSNASISGGKDLSVMYTLGWIALIILFTACVNYVNLSIGKASSRGMEISVRKVLGAERKQLRHQFWSESLIVSAMSMMVGLALAWFFIPTFNSLSGGNIALSDFMSLNNIGALFVLMLVVSLLAGSYPAIIISRMNPAVIFRGKFKLSGKNYMTKVLVVFQFAISAMLIIASFVMTSQTKFMITKNPGFDKDGVVVVNIQEKTSADGVLVVNRFDELSKTYSNVKSVSAVRNIFTRGNTWGELSYEGQTVRALYDKAHYGYINTMGMTLVEGRDFSRTMPGDDDALIINEAFVKELGLDNPIGKQIDTGRNNFKEVIGVVGDFNFQKLSKEIKPLFITLDAKDGRSILNYLLIRINTSDISGAVENIGSVWKEIQPDKPLRLSFLDNELERRYNSEKRLLSIIQWSTIFALIIAGMGILGLTSVILSAKTKEIGIMKVLGAKSSTITYGIIKDFIVMTVIANAITWPLSYYFMNKWLENFAYRINVDPLLFVLAIVITLLLCLLIVGTQAMNAAAKNPVDSLRYE